jgi:hypothetical protein
MFESTSRYFHLKTSTYMDPSGREITYVHRRFLPQGEQQPLLVEVTVTDGDRLDLIAARTIGDPEQFWRLADANNAMNPFDLIQEIYWVKEPGISVQPILKTRLRLDATIRVPIPQVET